MYPEPSVLTYATLPGKLGEENVLPVYFQRVEDRRITIEAYLPAACTEEQQQRCCDQFRERGADAVELVLVTDIPAGKVWLEGWDAS